MKATFSFLSAWQSQDLAALLSRKEKSLVGHDCSPVTYLQFLLWLLVSSSFPFLWSHECLEHCFCLFKPVLQKSRTWYTSLVALSFYFSSNPEPVTKLSSAPFWSLPLLGCQKGLISDWKRKPSSQFQFGWWVGHKSHWLDDGQTRGAVDWETGMSFTEVFMSIAALSHLTPCAPPHLGTMSFFFPLPVTVSLSHSCGRREKM